MGSWNGTVKSYFFFNPHLCLGEPLAAVQELGDLGGVACDEALLREVLHAVLRVQVEEVEADAVLPLPHHVATVARLLGGDLRLGGGRHGGRAYPDRLLCLGLMMLLMLLLQVMLLLLHL